MHTSKCNLERHCRETFIVRWVDLGEGDKGPSRQDGRALEGGAEEGNEAAADEDRYKSPVDDVEDTRGVAGAAADEEEEGELGAVDAKVEDGLADCKGLANVST
jgi:hypothetical protein